MSQIVHPVPPLTAEQQACLDKIHSMRVGFGNPAITVWGPAGSGKTTLLARLLADIPDALSAAFTGKAASVLRRKTGHPAQTVHGVIYRLLNKPRGAVKSPDDLEFVRVWGDGDLGGKTLILDECGMISQDIGHDLVRTGLNIIAFGDPGQLPPIKGRPFFNHCDFELTRIHRQALESPIIRQAHRVRNGEACQGDGPDFRVRDHLTERDLAEADVVLCFRNETRQAVNSRLRRLRGHAGYPRLGEPVLCLRTVHWAQLFNGEIYNLTEDWDSSATETVRVTDAAGRLITVRASFDGYPLPPVKFFKNGSLQPLVTRFDFGYALTVHKAQGSEWAHVALIDEHPSGDSRSRWLYSGLTRAAEKIVISRGADQ